MHDRDARLTPPDKIELRQLRYFVAVAEELNFTRAADRLHLAQQALSASIRSLEADLGVRLFERSTRHVSLTTAGVALLEGARTVLDATDAAVAAVARVSAGQSGRLDIGFSTASGAVPRVRELIRRFSAGAPDVDLRLVERDFSDPMAGLLSGETQVAFVFAPLLDDRLEAINVLTEPRHVAIPGDHPLAERPDLRTVDLSGLRWLRVPAPPSAWTRFWFEHPLGESLAGAEIRTADEWVPAIESGRGVAYTLPTVMANYPNTLITTRHVVDLEPGEIVLAWRGDDADPLVASFIASAREVLDPRTD